MPIQGFIGDIEKLTKKNRHFRHVLYTAEHSQLVVMTLQPKQDIGSEIHQLDQFIRIEAGHGTAIINGRRHALHDGSAVVIPARSRHNIINTSKTGLLKLYSLYSPPEHENGIIHRTKAEAEKSDEHFNGRTSEGKHARASKKRR